MNRDRLNEAESAARVFLQRVVEYRSEEQHRREQNADDWERRSIMRPGDIAIYKASQRLETGFPESSALRRASMDLTRALAELRRS